MELLVQNNGVQQYTVFVTLHGPQLRRSGIPEKFWLTLYMKLEREIFDAGNAFAIFKIEYEEKRHTDPLYTVCVTKEDGIDCDDGSQIYLIDHAWTYENNFAVQELVEFPGLLDRMCALMGIPQDKPSEEKIEAVYREMWRYNQSYSHVVDGDEAVPLWYIMDEFGSAIEHADDPNFKTIPFYYIENDTAYTLLFPIKNVSFKERVTRDYLQGRYWDFELMRKAFLIPWRPFSFLDVSFLQREPLEESFLSDYMRESLPEDQTPLIQDKARILKVYSNYGLVNSNLDCNNFEIVESENRSDILWLTYHYRDYKGFQEQHPEKYINQFPNESVLTMKNLLAAVCRRKQVEDIDEYADNPPWYPTTYNLNTELIEFVSYYQHRERDGFNNLWICKAWNLARGLDTVITDNLNCILRLPASGPKVAQKYVHDPILFHRPDVGLVKFDIRYVLLLKSVKPLRLYAYRNFFLRFANRPYDLTDFWDMEKHYTVMNYNSRASLFRMLCDEFIEKFRDQNPEYLWADVEEKIFKAFREIFEAATSRPPPYGICHSVQSRALYAVDVILRIENSVIQPKILEVNWMPDCSRACEYYPSFFNDVFLLLFKDIYDEEKFQLL